MRIEIVVPCFNEQECISLLYDEVERVFRNMKEYDFSILYVDDGSRDKTLENIKLLAEKHGKERVKFISFSKNFGKESAIFAGLSKSTGDYVVLMDADLQHPPVILPQMIMQMEQGYDVCGARRISRRGEPFIRSRLSKLFYDFINRVTSVQFVQGGSDFRMMKKKVVQAIISMEERERFTKGLISWVGFNVKWIEYENVERVAGKTKWSLGGLFKYALSGFFAFATTPLRAAVYLGLIIDIGSVLYTIFVIISALTNNAPRTGFSTIIILLMFFGGTIILLLGIIGEYLARIYMEVKKRPIFIVNDTNI